MRRALGAIVLATAALAAAAPAGSATLQTQLQAKLSGASLLKAAIAGDTAKITGYQGQVADLQSRLSAVQGSLDDETAQLGTLKSRLRSSRSHLLFLRHKEAADRRVLARQLVAQYEAQAPGLVDVVISARGFSDLLDAVDQMRTIGERNAHVAAAVVRARKAKQAEAGRLAFLTAREQRIASAMLSQHDQIARLKLTVVGHQLAYEHARDAKSSKLKTLTSQARHLSAQIAQVQAKEAQEASPGIAIGGGAVTGDSGSYGFFPAAGTNYSVGAEPTLAARLSQLGKALHLHLIGISGYRSPQHSVEVGGFANDPHTRGQASDTPGVEGVSEATLNAYGLTRPFGGAAEADHIQLAG